MIINKYINSYIILSLIITIGVGAVACDLDKNENYLQNNATLNKRVTVNIEEAKILSDISILNETIMALNGLSLEKNRVYRVKNISHKLKKDNIEIKNSLNDLAKKKLILLPTKWDKKEINELSEIDEASFSKVYLKKTEKLLESEIAQLQYLATITNDVDFKVLTVKILLKLNYNLNQIHKTLKTNY